MSGLCNAPVGAYPKATKRAKIPVSHSPRALDILAVIIGSLLLVTACAPASPPTPTPSPTLAPSRTPVPSPQPSSTAAPMPTPTALEPQLSAVEGLVMLDNEQLIIGVNWTSKSRITYMVQGGDVEAVRKFLGETARVTGVIVERSPWLKEILVRTVEASTATERLSMRTGIIAELGTSIYMQGTHLLGDREGRMICLLDARQSGLDLDSYVRKGQVRVIGVMSKTVEGNALIMEVKLVEKIE